MPKAKSESKTKAARKDPISTKTKPPAKLKDPKASHLYTDDNPSTTIHGTGFKDSAAAIRTLDLIKDRSLIYQWQTVNTMYNRAKHHPAMKKAVDGAASTQDMRNAMEVFKTWLEETYPASKAALRGSEGFKPLLSKKVVERYLSRIEESGSVGEQAKAFARMYVALPKGKKLGNVLVDDGKPTEADWDRKRYDVLCGIVAAGKDEGGEEGWKVSELWADDRVVTGQHLELIALAWSPVKEAKLP
ncbi:hypothetical protein LTR78_008580 [Recurvomyces mirabilis]|uniref:Uncharacterized protein n=1 Tax=Recurvomyces mirabilis TaxID=574656 RepID=A0AAE0TPR7_9PEZI|nr:hypothetical protein LTR78_008580 [Recurvomyces mirabilis]KAK5153508.1 hypothetical protein LTS14_007679 [Recurvomyces mirabilis]